MNKYEFFVERPIKVEVEAESEEKALQIIQERLKINPNDNVRYSKPIEITIEEEAAPAEENKTEES